MRLKIGKSRTDGALTLRPSVSALFLFCCALYLPSSLLGQASQPTNNTTGPEQPLAPLDLSAGGSGQGSYKTTTQDEYSKTQPDTHALSGVEDLTTGSLHRFGSFFDPGLYFSDFSYAGPGLMNSSALTSGATIGATLDAGKNWGPSNLVITYHGSDTYYYPYTFYGPRNMPSQNLGLSLGVSHGRWTFRLHDNLLYSWQAGFGSLFTGGPAVADPNSPLTPLQPSLSPAGTILTGFARQVNDSAAAEVDYSISRRTVVTLSGSYGVLHFLTPGYLNSEMIDGRAGYNYSLSSKNTLALILEYDATSFSGTSTRFNSDLIQMSFGRKITGRLALQLAAGPELTVFRNYGPSNAQQLSWNVSGSMTYQTPHTAYFLSYFRGVTPGSGVFFGSRANTLIASANHLWTKSWSSSLNGGYASNNSLIPSGIFAQNFDDWFAGASISKQLGRRAHVALSYQYQKQIIGSGTCPVASCGVAPDFQAFGITLDWHPWLNRLQ